MKKSKQKKAFTLTELLVVVIVIGVLSAVVLPKFSKVVETRKTTEAEELMSAVRTEQEKRCALDKSYVTSLTAVKDIVPSGTSKNYAYSLTSTGMEAQSKGKYGYTLKMPSYADGRICCENEAECAKLNKDYPLCSALMARADYRSGAECAGESEEKQCTGSSTRSCGCNNGGTQTRTCDTSTGTWSGWSACSISDACSCEGESTRACGCQGKGTQTRTCNTSNGTWGEWGACSVADECECTGTKPEESQTCNDCGTQTRSVTCNASTGEWSTGAWGECSKTEEECLEEQDCCSDSLSESAFKECLAAKYGLSSTEYVCANGTNLGYHADIGSISGAAACASKLVGFGCFLRAANGRCESSDTYCQQLRSDNIGWISGGFKKYACSGATPNISAPTPVEPEEQWTWQTADWSNSLIRNGSCNSMNPSAIVAEHCASSKAMNGMVDSCPSTPTEGVQCQLSCRLGGKVYPKGTLMNYDQLVANHTVLSAFNDVSCTCLGSMVGSGPDAHCGGNQACHTICVIPYTHTVKYAVKQ